MLPAARLALGELNRNRRSLKPTTNLTNDVFVAGGLHDLIVLHKWRVRQKVAVSLVVQLVVRVAEEIKLNLAADHRLEVHSLCSRDLVTQNLAGCHRNRLTCLHREHITENQCSFRHPGSDANGAKVGARDHVAVTKVV